MKLQHTISIRATLMVAAILLLTTRTDAAVFLLDADTPATGSLLGTTPVVTPYGTVTFAGEIRDRDSDPEFTAAGAVGNVFDINNATSTAALMFNFDVDAITFIYGGNTGVIDIRARDMSGATIASFFQANTDAGQPAGPITLSGVGIRSLFWTDPGRVFAPLDNLQVEVSAVPEPSASLLGSLALLSIFLRRPSNESSA